MDEPTSSEREHSLADGPLPPYYRRIKQGASGGAVQALGAAMIAVGEILEPEKTAVEIEQPADGRDDDGLDLDFGDLPALD